MRKSIAISAGSACVALLAAVGCQSRTPQEAMTADLQRDLNLAGSVRAPHMATVSAIELSPPAVKKSAAGDKASSPINKRATTPPVLTEITEMVKGNHATINEAAITPVTLQSRDSVVAVAAGPTPATGVDPDVQVYVSAPASGPSAGMTDIGVERRTHIISNITGAIIRGTSVGVDNCEPPVRRGTPDRGGAIGAILGGDRGGMGTGLGGGSATPRMGRPRY